MILADTSIWIDHLHRGDAKMATLLDAGEILMHPHVRGEIALGNLRDRAEILGRLSQMPQAVAAQDDEVLHLVERHAWFGTGIGLIDAHLLAATLLTADARLWTRDGRLKRVADALGVSVEPA